MFLSLMKQQRESTLSFETEQQQQQPDLIKEVYTMKISKKENYLKSFENSSYTKSFSSSTEKGNDENCHHNGKKFGHKVTKSEYLIKVSGDGKIKKKKRKENRKKSSCIPQ